MKIKFLTMNIEQVGGIETVIKNLSNYFANKLNYEVEIISFFGERKENSINNLSNNVNRKYLNMKRLEEKNRLSQYFNMLRYKKQIESFLVNQKCDVLITTHFLFNMIVLLNKKNLNYKIIGSEHCDYFQAGRLLRIIRNIFYRKLDHFVVLTEHAYNNYSKYLKNVKIINNSVSFETDKISSCENKRIIALGRLEEEKGFEGLIEILAEVIDEESEWKVDIYGEGTREKIIKNMIKTNKLESKINVNKFIDDVKSELLSSSIFVLPSKSEAFSLVLLEAMECGLCVISYNLSGPNEIINNGYDGIIVDSKEEFIEKLKIIMSNQSIRTQYGINAKKSIEKYHMKNIAKEWSTMFYE